tara:strand:+ start:5201 stop:6166 length:966 start_codon:yes stop_codon:yes gene_type:complete
MALNDIVVPSRKQKLLIKHGVIITKPFFRKHLKRQFYYSRGYKLPMLEIGLLTLVVFLIKSKKSRMFSIHLPRDLIYVFIKLIKPNIKFFCTMHNDRKNFKVYHLLLFFFTKSLVQKTICVSNAVYNSMRFFVSKSCVIDNSVPIEEIKKYRKKIRRNDLIIVGRFVEQKNVFYMKQVIDALPHDLKVIWVGAGRLRTQIKELDSTRRITFLETLSRCEVYKLLGNTKCYLCLSRWEGVGVSNLEAIAAGCSVVLSDIAPHREISKVADVELVSLSSDVDEIASLIQKTLQHFTSKLLTQFFISKYQNKNMLKKYDELFYE